MRNWKRLYGCALVLWIALPLANAQSNPIGREAAIPEHLQNGQEFRVSLTTLLEFGKQLFTANWTIQEGQGRPLAKGVGTPTALSDPSSPLMFPRNFNRFSAPDANSCAGCHNVPIPGGAGLPPQALNSSGAGNPPSLILQPWHQVGNVVSLRQFTTNAFHHHHGMQAEERFGAGVDQDGDGLADELTRADITAATLFQAAMAVPGRVIPNDPVLQSAILNGESVFAKIGCASC